MIGSLSPRVTRWVGRLMAINAVVLLLQLTVFTSPEITAALQFTPSAPLRHPWSYLSYMFLHAGILHLAANMLLLFVFGPAVERRLGSRSFLGLYFASGIGAAAFSAALAGFINMPPFIGASGAILGVAVVFAQFWPDAELLAFPIPVPISARTFVGILLAFDLIGAIWFNDQIAHRAHLGGALFGFLYLQAFALVRRRTAPQPVVPRRAVMATQVHLGLAAHKAAPPSAPHAEMSPALDQDAIDRVLDKISASGIESLTQQERRFLADVSERKRNQGH